MKIVSWNIQWCLGVDGRVDPQRIVDEARAFADFDVLCLQEVACNFPALKGSAGEDQFAADRGAAAGLHRDPGHRRRHAGARRLPAPFGNMILSRLPVRQVTRVQLPWPCDPTCAHAAHAARGGGAGAVRPAAGDDDPPRVLLGPAARGPGRGRSRPACRGERACAPRPGGRSLRGPVPQPAADAVGGADRRLQLPHQRPRLCAHDRALRRAVPPFEDAWTVLHPGVAHAPTVGVHDREQWPEPFTCDFFFATRDLRERLRAISVDALDRRRRPPAGAARAGVASRAAARAAGATSPRSPSRAGRCRRSRLRDRGTSLRSRACPSAPAGP